MEPVRHYAELDDVMLSYVEWRTASADKPTLLFVHATGFHARIWDMHAASLDAHIIAVDQRGHGFSQALPISHWNEVGRDLAQLVSHLKLERLIGVGHSMGAHALIDCAALSGAFDQLLLFDPTVASPDAYAAAEPTFEGDVHPASKRRREFASPEEMIERIEGKSAFPLFRKEILRDYCVHGLEPIDEGGYRLRCAPEIEASVYMTARTNGGVYDSIRTIDVPVTVVRAQEPSGDGRLDWSASPTWPDLAQSFSQGRDVHWQDCSHFIPMQRPEACVELMQQCIDAWPQSREA